jgi:DNA-3-methyladenine glycosylase
VNGKRLPRSFFERDPVTCARELIGVEFAWKNCAGLLVETEAYSVINDEACHTFLRKAVREFVARNPPGTAYVYLNYGIHWLANVLVKGGTEDGFVLLRAIEPTRGLGEMQRRRGITAIERLCSGPGKLTQALGITGGDDGCDLCSGARGFFESPTPVRVVADVRIGITRSASLPWRFLAEDSRFLSAPVQKRRPDRAKQPGLR